MHEASEVTSMVTPPKTEDEVRPGLDRRPSESPVPGPHHHGPNGVGIGAAVAEALGIHGAAEAVAAVNGLNGIRPDSSHSHSTPPARKDTNSSISTAASIATLATLATNETANSTYSAESSPNYSPQGIFSAKDGTDINGNRRPSRRRTGPLSALQRERAALIRKMGACGDCRRRRVACHPSHHNMTWEDAALKFQSQSQLNNVVQDLAPSGRGPRPLSPALTAKQAPYTHDSHEMEIDSPPTHHQSLRPSLGESRINRTPLPSGPRLEKPANMTPPSAADSAKSEELQATASLLLSNPFRSPYTTTEVLLLHWEDDDDRTVRAAMEELVMVLEQHYFYTFTIKSIPIDGCKSSRWLLKTITEFIDQHDSRDVLKIVYYSGHTYLDGNREMVLSSPRTADPSLAIRWSVIQQILESAASDILIIMDAAYYPSSKMVRQQGVLELIAASASEDHLRFLDRGAFTQALTAELRMRASQKFMNPLSAAELHAKLLTLYPKMVQDRSPEKEVVTSFPSPLHIQLSANTRLPSIMVAPVHKNPPFGLESPPSGNAAGAQLSITFRLNDDTLNTEAWKEWLRLMPEGIKDARVEGPYRNSNTFR